MAGTSARISFLQRLLEEIGGTRPLADVLDAGCGIGLFSDVLSRSAETYLGFDARPENVQEAKRRFPTREFVRADIEHRDVLDVGVFDLVSCMGLLYHLENPILALRHLRQLTGRLAIVETRIAPGKSPVGVVEERSDSVDHALNRVALVFSESAYVYLLYRAGFSYVYRPVELPDHRYFRQSWRWKRQRTVLVATMDPLSLPSLDLQPEPATKTGEGGYARLAQRVLVPPLRVLRRPFQ